MFNDLKTVLDDKGGSVRAYDAAARAARARLSAEPGNAAALLLVAYAAQRFVEAYDDQPLTQDAAGEERAQFEWIVDTLDAAFESGSADEKVKALNAVAARIAG
ncbi:MAG: hypothetical protein MEQ84_03310 [Mesorhizobium sp.]|nr:hypothetical protein [Mesorhizobium sp.]